MNEVISLIYLAGMVENISTISVLAAMISGLVLFISYIEIHNLKEWNKFTFEFEKEDKERVEKFKRELEGKTKLFNFAKYIFIISFILSIILPNKIVLYTIAAEKLTNNINTEKNILPEIKNITISINKKIQHEISK